MKPATLFSLLTLSCSPAAAYNCTTVTSPGFAMNYDVGGNTLVEQSTFTVSCSRSSGDPTSLTYTVGVDNGSNPAGGYNRARRGTTSSYVSYELYRDSSCSVLWGATAAQRITDTITWSSAADTSTISRPSTYWACGVAGQTGMTSGVYTDSVQMTLRWGGTNRTGNVPVSIYAPAVCTVLAAPAPLVFNYTAFGAAVNTSSTFRVRCNSGMSYNLSLNSTTGTLAGVGLDYTLSVTSAAIVGTGLFQTQTISGSMPAGQAGTCPAGSCTDTNAHTVTVVY
jgi:spore coat protein U-like protein